jgi:hypothetical protein
MAGEGALLTARGGLPVLLCPRCLTTRGLQQVLEHHVFVKQAVSE